MRNHQHTHRFWNWVKVARLLVTLAQLPWKLWENTPTI